MSCAVKRAPLAAGPDAFQLAHQAAGRLVSLGRPQPPHQCNGQPQQAGGLQAAANGRSDGLTDDKRPREQPAAERLTTFKRPVGASASGADANNNSNSSNNSNNSNSGKNSNQIHLGAGAPSDKQRWRRERRRDSLESLESRVSTSSGHLDGAPGQPARATSRSVLVGTRYVEPPRVGASGREEKDDDQLISELAADWQTIDLDESGGGGGAERPPQVELARRLSSPFTRLARGCKLLSGGGGSGGGSGGEAAGGRAPSTPERGQESSPSSRSAGRKWAEGGPEAAAAAAAARAANQEGALMRKARESLGGGGGEQVAQAPPAAARRQIGKSQAPFMFAGILASILGSVFFSMAMLTIKLLPDGHGLAEKTKIVCFRGCVIMLLCGVTITYQRSTFRVRRDELWVNVLRSLFGFAGVYGAYISLKYISMGDSTALVFSSPIWTSLLSHFILNEPLQWVQLIALPASLVGIVFIAHPALLVSLPGEHAAGATERQPALDVLEVAGLENETLAAAAALDLTAPTTSNASLLMVGVESAQPLANNSALLAVAALNQTLNRDLDIAVNAHEQFDFEHRWKGIAVALATSFIVSCVYIVLKFRKSTPIQTTTFWLGAFTVGASLVVMLIIGPGQMPRSLYEWSLLLLNGLCSWLGQVLLQWALAYEDASVLSVIRTLDVAMTFTLSALFLEEEILWTSVLGAAIIAAVVVSIMLNSWLTRRLCPPKRARVPEAQLGELEPEAVAAGARAQVYAISGAEKGAPRAGEITLKLEAPSVRKRRDGEAAA